jgi:hypothetical protein
METFSGFIVDEISEAARVYEADLAPVCETECTAPATDSKKKDKDL